MKEKLAYLGIATSSVGSALLYGGQPLQNQALNIIIPIIPTLLATYSGMVLGVTIGDKK